VPRAAKPFFISGVHNPPGAVGHVVAPELPSQEGRALSRGTRDDVGAHLSKEVRSEAVGHVAAPEPPLQGGVVQSYSLCGSVWIYALLLILT
jgi:hypothetical protein